MVGFPSDNRDPYEMLDTKKVIVQSCSFKLYIIYTLSDLGVILGTTILDTRIMKSGWNIRLESEWWFTNLDLTEIQGESLSACSGEVSDVTTT